MAEDTEITHAGFAVQAEDTGRVLLIQRSMDQDDAPEVQGTWEFPGGGLEADEDPETAARREFSEETGLPVPPGEVTGGWRSPDGIYQGFVFTTPVEADAFPELNPDLAAAELVNPDDPERRNPDVSAWFTLDQILNLGPALRPECYTTDWTQFAGGDMATEPDDDTVTDVTEEPIPETDVPEEDIPVDLDAVADEDDDEVAANLETGYIPWHGVLAVEGKRSGDGRKFSRGALTHRPLPLPMGWQETSASGHSGTVITQRIDQMMRVGDEIRANGVILPTDAADKMIGLVAHFPRFGVSIDADDASLAMDDPDDPETVTFDRGRVCSASVLPIPAFAEAWQALGDHPADFYEGGSSMVVEDYDSEEEALVASAITDFTIKTGKTEDGPGWLTHPIPTDRLRDYWVRGAGAAKIGWGTPGDFNRCRVNVAEYVKPQHLNGYCANRHYDALGFWPGRAPSEQVGLQPQVVSGEPTTFSQINLVDPGETLLAGGGLCAPAEWFEDPQLQGPTALNVTEEGRVFGHVATWGTCHTGFAKVCREAPRSETGYAYFLLGQVLTTEGMVATGSLTVGGGHADVRLGIRAAMAHYDNSCTAWADVACGEDEYGIWVGGWVRPGTTPEQVVAARASKLSGDWRRVGGSMEMMAALCVNMPGFPIPRAHVAAGLQTSLVASGVVEDEQPRSLMSADLPIEAQFSEAAMDGFVDQFHAAVARREQAQREQAALLEKFPDTSVAEQAALLARFE